MGLVGLEVQSLVTLAPVLLSTHDPQQDHELQVYPEHPSCREVPENQNPEAHLILFLQEGLEVLYSRGTPARLYHHRGRDRLSDQEAQASHPILEVH